MLFEKPRCSLRSGELHRRAPRRSPLRRLFWLLVAASVAVGTLMVVRVGRIPTIEIGPDRPGIGSAGLSGRLRVKGLAAIYLGALPVWIGDDSPDQGRTMAFLDRRLKQAERLARLLPDARGRRTRPAAPAE